MSESSRRRLGARLSPDGAKLATGGYDQTIKVLGGRQRHGAAHYQGAPGQRDHRQLQPDNQWLASGSIDGLVKIWSGNELPPLPWERGRGEGGTFIFARSALTPNPSPEGGGVVTSAASPSPCE